jgi:beta-lactamase family protein
VARAAVAALALSLLAVGFTVAAGSRGGEARPLGKPASGLYPSLRAVGDLGRPDGRATDAGLGVYPALRAPSSLVFPGPEALQAARVYAATRQGRVAFAVAGERGGIVGQAVDQPFASASLLKAMILVAYLDKVEANGEGLSSADVNRLDAMIRVSDNYSASATFRRLGSQPLRELARRAGLRSFSIDGDWGNARITAADQVRFFLALDRLLPAPRRRSYARYLLSHIASFHAWGIPAVARPRWRVFFKGGWRPDGGGDIVHQAALLERGPRRIAIAVLTDRDPSESYGRRTIRGVAERLLRPASSVTPAPAPARLAPLAELAHSGK